MPRVYGREGDGGYEGHHRARDRDSSSAPFRLTWSYTDAEGRPGIEGEDCVYMTKRLVP